MPSRSPDLSSLTLRPSSLAPRYRLLAALTLVLVAALIVLPPSDDRLPPLTVYSTEPDGGRALWLWLDALGYDVVTIEATPYRIPSEAATVLILSPTTRFSRGELDALESWVRAGGTAVLVVEGLVAGTILERFEIGLRALPVVAEYAVPTGNGLLDPAIRQVRVDANEALEPRSPSATPLLVAADEPEQVIGTLVPVGKGRVLALPTRAALSNQALRSEDNARLALSLVGPPGRGAVAVDELHHGFGAAPPRSLTRLLVDQAWGRAALYAGLVVLVFLLFRGRRFGRPRPAVVSRGRSLAEYVSSLAGLYRAGAKRAFVAEHFRHHLCGALAERYGLPRDATDDQIGARTRALGRDPGPALRIVNRLARGGALSEGELVRLVRAGERMVSSEGQGVSGEGRGARR